MHPHSPLPSALNISIISPQERARDVASMSAMLDNVERCDLESVKRLVAEGADVKERFHCYTYTSLLFAATHGYIPIMDWLLTEGGSSLAERTLCGESVLLLAARNSRFLCDAVAAGGARSFDGRP
jgi:ankyrin repeat protein